jgi:hypothetical protein
LERHPVLVLGHSRPDLTARILEAVKSYGPARLYLACDGPAGNSSIEGQKVSSVRKVMLDAELECEVLTRFSESNQGLRRGVVNAIDWFFSHESEGIILEDDCLPGPGFFHFCEMILDRFRETPTVWGAGGYNPTGIPFQDGTYGFIRFAMIWGWATWADRWKKYDRDLIGYQQRAVWGAFDWPSTGLYHGLDWHLKRYLENPRSWDYQLSWSVVAEGGLWAMPDRNLVENLGFGEMATNTKNRMFDHQSIRSLGPIRHPKGLSPDVEAERLFLRRHLRVYSPGWLNYLRNLVRTLRILRQGSS